MGGGLGACPQEVLNALKCVLGASEASFCACIQYIYTCKLVSLFSSFRSKSMTYWALTSGLCMCALMFVFEQHKCEAKKQADLKSTIQ